MHAKASGAGVVLENSAGTANEKIVQEFVTNGGVYRLRGLDDTFASTGGPGIEIDLGSGDFSVNCTTPNFDFVVGENCLRSRVPVHQPFTSIDKPIGE